MDFSSTRYDDVLTTESASDENEHADSERDALEKFFEVSSHFFRYRHRDDATNRVN
jgi:hypothetical protein